MKIRYIICFYNKFTSDCFEWREKTCVLAVDKRLLVFWPILSWIYDFYEGNLIFRKIGFLLEKITPSIFPLITVQLISYAFYIIVWFWYASLQIWCANGVLSMQHSRGIKVPSHVLGMIGMVCFIYYIWYTLGMIGMIVCRDGGRL